MDARRLVVRVLTCLAGIAAMARAFEADFHFATGGGVRVEVDEEQMREALEMAHGERATLRLPFLDGSLREFTLERDDFVLEMGLRERFPGVANFVGVQTADRYDTSLVKVRATYSTRLGLSALFSCAEHGDVALDTDRDSVGTGKLRLNFRDASATAAATVAGASARALASDPAPELARAERRGLRNADLLPGCAVHLQRGHGDLVCDPAANTAECDFDGGDCCSPFAVCKPGAEKADCVCADSEHGEARHRRFRIAIGVTEAYAAAFDSDEEAILASVATLVSRVNVILQRDLSIDLELAAGTDALFDLDGALLGSAKDFSDLAERMQDAAEAELGRGSFDLGHALTTKAGGVGGAASLGSMCLPKVKARAASAVLDSETGIFDYWRLAHELGRQLGARDTGSACSDTSQLTADSERAEAGSGASAMGYGPDCGGQNVVLDPRTLFQFHARSIEAIRTFLRSPWGARDCGRLPSGQAVIQRPKALNTLDTHPTCSEEGAERAAAVRTCKVPMLTPFRLDAPAADLEDNSLFYTWEQVDEDVLTRPRSIFNPQARTSVLYASAVPTRNSASRQFPRADLVLRGMGFMDAREPLPFVPRKLRFVQVVRSDFDGTLEQLDAVGASFVSQTVEVETVVDQPLRVRAPASPLPRDEPFVLAWSGATNVAQHVRILLSLDGGRSFPMLLAEKVPNTGSASLSLAGLVSCQLGVARIKVESVDQLEGCSFFAINDGDLEVDGCGPNGPAPAPAGPPTIPPTIPQDELTGPPTNSPQAPGSPAPVEELGPVTEMTELELPAGPLRTYSWIVRVPQGGVVASYLRPDAVFGDADELLFFDGADEPQDSTMLGFVTRKTLGRAESTLVEASGSSMLIQLRLREGVSGVLLYGPPDDVTVPDPPVVSPSPPSPSASTESPTKSPAVGETEAPTLTPSQAPSRSPNADPTTSPTRAPSRSPNSKPTESPSKSPTSRPSRSPTLKPTQSPVAVPSKSPSAAPSLAPTWKPSRSPSAKEVTPMPTMSPSAQPSDEVIWLGPGAGRLEGRLAGAASQANWAIRANPGEVVEIRFAAINLGGNYEVIVRDGVVGPVMRRILASENGKTDIKVRSSGKDIGVSMLSTKVDPALGFDLAYASVPRAISIELGPGDGKLTGDLADAAAKEWTIVAAPESIVALRFSGLWLGIADRITVQDGVGGTGTPLELTSLSNGETTVDYLSTVGSLRVTLTGTQAAGARVEAEFSSRPLQVRTVGPASGKLAPVKLIKPDMHWIIHAAEGDVVELRVDTLSLVGQSGLAIHDGFEGKSVRLLPADNNLARPLLFQSRGRTLHLALWGPSSPSVVFEATYRSVPAITRGRRRLTTDGTILTLESYELGPEPGRFSDDSDSDVPFSQPYPPAQDKTWVITLDEGARVGLRFDAFQTEESLGMVTVSDGESGRLIGSFSGSRAQGKVVQSESNVMIVRFLAGDNPSGAPGFEAEYFDASDTEEAEDVPSLGGTEEEGGGAQDDQVEVDSKGTEITMFPGTKRRFIIETDADETVEVVFKTLMLVDGMRVEIFDGPDDGAVVLRHATSGLDQLPFPVRSTQQRIMVQLSGFPVGEDDPAVRVDVIARAAPPCEDQPQTQPITPTTEDDKDGDLGEQNPPSSLIPGLSDAAIAIFGGGVAVFVLGLGMVIASRRRNRPRRASRGFSLRSFPRDQGTADEGGFEVANPYFSEARSKPKPRPERKPKPPRTPPSIPRSLDDFDDFDDIDLGDDDRDDNLNISRASLPRDSVDTYVRDLESYLDDFQDEVDAYASKRLR